MDKLAFVFPTSINCQQSTTLDMKDCQHAYYCILLAIRGGGCSSISSLSTVDGISSTSEDEMTNSRRSKRIAALRETPLIKAGMRIASDSTITPSISVRKPMKRINIDDKSCIDSTNPIHVMKSFKTGRKTKKQIIESSDGSVSAFELDSLTESDISDFEEIEDASKHPTLKSKYFANHGSSEIPAGEVKKENITKNENIIQNDNMNQIETVSDIPKRGKFSKKKEKVPKPVTLLHNRRYLMKFILK